MIIYTLAKDKQFVELHDANLGGEPLFVCLSKWELEVDDGRIYHTDQLVFIHIRNDINFKAFKTILGARQSITMNPGYTFSIDVMRVY